MGYTQFTDDVFVVNSWADNENKENILIELLNKLKVYNCPIILCGHHPINPETQKLADYYLYGSNSDTLLETQYENYGINCDSIIVSGNYTLTNRPNSIGDYNVWSTMKIAFLIAQQLGKSYIHYLDYDNLPDEVQYRQAFIEYVRNNDIVVRGDVEKSIGVFSIKTNVAIEMINKIKNKEDYFKQDDWRLNNVIYRTLNDMRCGIFNSMYIPNENELEIFSKDKDVKFNLGVENEQLFIHVEINPNKKDYLLEVIYDNYKKFISLKSGETKLERLGEYKNDKSVKVYHQGTELFSQKLAENVEDFTRKNRLMRKKESKNRRLNVNFIDGAFVEIIEDVDNIYNVQFINKKTNKIEYQLNLRSNHWSRCSIKYQVDWLIKIKGIDNDFTYEHHLDFKNKRVMIAFESKSLGDTLSFFPYVEKFRVDNDCHVICATFNNSLFVDQYPNIEFVEPGINVNNLYALYRLGLFFKTYQNGMRGINTEYHPIDPKTIPLSKIPSDILGLDYVELRPKLKKLGGEKKKVVCIAPHSTAQAKYWNNPNGWQDVTNHLINKGYEVRLLSREEDGYMGNRNPVGVVQQPRGPLTDVLKTLQESELFIGLGSGLSWLAWSAEVPVILISGFSDDYTEPTIGVSRIINKNVCNSCWNRHNFDPGDWNWCPDHKGTERQFECSRNITSEQVIREIDLILS